jgi:hypothetical protein
MTLLDVASGPDRGRRWIRWATGGALLGTSFGCGMPVLLSRWLGGDRPITDGLARIALVLVGLLLAGGLIVVATPVLGRFVRGTPDAPK